ncbi:phosphonopyruvate decarboxylase [Desulfamplus magnetovallimortis]|nr:phosphonopyruvate decarboxylase [Desulfamplus magnetovallimortis]
MIPPDIFCKTLQEKGVGMFAGVPDSLLKHLCAHLHDNWNGRHIITANEGNAIALAAGFHMATGSLGAVYMQNSGLGNCVNPLTSLTDPDVYSIPLLLIIGWRGEPGIKDEPQHVKQGRITRDLLEILDIPHWILNGKSDWQIILQEIFSAIKDRSAPVALLIQKDTFEPHTTQQTFQYGSNKKYTLKREDALSEILDLVNPHDLIISTTGKTSRELFELREKRGEYQRDFLTVGSMGHASSIALGVAMGRRDRRVICLDGDGALLMHMGALPVIGNIENTNNIDSKTPSNLIHIVLNNAAYESVGGQPTVAGKMNMDLLSRSCGYKNYHLAYDINSLKKCWMDISRRHQGPNMLEIQIATGSRQDLGRPTTTPMENKNAFMKNAFANV